MVGSGLSLDAQSNEGRFSLGRFDAPCELRVGATPGALR
jgi:hypothetical protein